MSENGLCRNFHSRYEALSVPVSATRLLPIRHADGYTLNCEEPAIIRTAAAPRSSSAGARDSTWRTSGGGPKRWAMTPWLECCICR